MSVLDELREMLRTRPYDIDECFEEFEAAHPGLSDCTITCDGGCGAKGTSWECRGDTGADGREWGHADVRLPDSGDLIAFWSLCPECYARLSTERATEVSSIWGYLQIVANADEVAAWDAES